ncbi:MAG: acyltransferase, partial [Candidatus Neomarinimicrobiota bacterium]
DHEIVISAQHRLEHFYVELGFTARGEVYLEDDIDHIQMYILPNERS